MNSQLENKLQNDNKNIIHKYNNVNMLNHFSGITKTNSLLGINRTMFEGLRIIEK